MSKITNILNKMNEGSNASETEKDLGKPDGYDLKSGVLVDGTKFALAVIKETGDDSHSFKYYYAYVSENQRMYSFTGYSGGTSGAGFEFKPMNTSNRYNHYEFVSWFK